MYSTRWAACKLRGGPAAAARASSSSQARTLSAGARESTPRQGFHGRPLPRVRLAPRRWPQERGIGGRRLAAADPTLHGARSHPDPADPLGTPVTTGEQAIEHSRLAPSATRSTGARPLERGAAPSGGRAWRRRAVGSREVCETRRARQTQWPAPETLASRWDMKRPPWR